MLEFLDSVFASKGFIPHGHCYLWKPSLVGLHLISDLAIALAYFSISISLVYLVRRIQLPFRGIFLAFGVFIAACGMTHLMEVWTLWHPIYWLSGEIKLITAVASVATAVLLPPLVPQVVSLMQTARLAEERRRQLETANHELESLYERVKELDDKFVTEGGRVSCSLEQEGDRAIIIIKDNGPGVPAELHQVIFERFQQGARGATEGGTGLRLAIAKEFVELHHGTIALDDVLDGGAWFTVTLPLAAPAGAGVNDAPKVIEAIAVPVPTPSPDLGTPSDLEDASRPRARIDNLIAVKQVREALQHQLSIQQQDVTTLTTTATLSQEQLQEALIALQRSEARFRRLAEASMIGVIFWDVNGEILDANDEFLRIVGYSRDDLQTGQIHWRKMTPPKYAELDEQALVELRTHGYITSMEKEYICKDGNRVPVVIGGAFLEDSQDQGVSFVLDISDRKRAEVALQAAYNELELRVQQRTLELSYANSRLQEEIAEHKQSEERYRLLADYSSDLISRHTLEGTFLYASPACRMLLGYEPEDVIGRSIYEFFHPDDAADFKGAQTAIGSLPESYVLCYRACHKTGYYRWVEMTIRLVQDLDGEAAPQLIIVSRDVDARKQIEFEIYTLNAELEQRVAERTAQLEMANQIKDDLLQREQVARTEAESANRMKDEFLATLSHELRTPLNAIMGWAQLLRSRTFDEVTTRQALETIERNARSQSQLVGDLLDVSRITQGKVRLNICSLKLVPLVAAALDSVRPAADAKGIQLAFHPDPAIESILGDPDRLQQVMWNLLSNAIKFTPPEGRVEVQVKQHNVTSVAVIVRDTGEGISSEFLPYVFDRFRQADGTLNRPYGGLGLGLAIVRHLVELHGGIVAVDSLGLGQGSTFSVILPIRPMEDGAAIARATKHDGIRDDMHTNVAPTTQNGRGSRLERQTSQDSTLEELQTPPAFFPFPTLLQNLWVLIVDDEADTRDFLVMLLQQYGAKTTAIASVSEAVEWLLEVDKGFPNMLISDIHMPDQDGYALIRQVRAIASNRGIHLPAVALTAHTGTDDRIKLLQAGFQIHVPKPVDPTELIAVIANLGSRIK